MQERILITGSLGQIGSELALRLMEMHGEENVIISDIRDPKDVQLEKGIYVQLDVLNFERWKSVLEEYKITQVYHLAAMLSATAEHYPAKSWDLNTTTLLLLLEYAKENKHLTLFWPSSIAVFGGDIDPRMAKQLDPLFPETLYGIAKAAGENLCRYYQKKYGVDVRTLRYPGLISWKTPPGGGTTDYAVTIYYDALEKGSYECFLAEETRLPMLYMDDAVRATIELMHYDKEKLGVYLPYNLTGLSFTPKELSLSIQKEMPDFQISYQPDERQKIAASWPQEVEDKEARERWGWQPEFSLDDMTKEMLHQLKRKLNL